MKANTKKALILALGLGLVTGATTTYKAYADTEIRYVENEQELKRVEKAIAELKDSKTDLDESINAAVERIRNSNPTEPTEEELKVLNPAYMKSVEAKNLIRKLETYKLKLEKGKPSDKDEDKPSEEDNKDKPSDDEQTPPKEEDKPTDENKPSEEKPKVTKTTLKEEIPFKTKRAVNDPNLETRIAQAGSNGFIEYELTYEGDKLIDKKVINKVEPTDEIIETYVKVKDAEIGTREVEDKSKPIYKTEYQQMAFVRGFYLSEYQETGEENIHYWEFDSYKEAYNFVEQNDIMGNYGDLDKYKEIKKLIGYEKKTETYEISPAVYEWR
ncbi:Uncharacterised protein [Anaerococcus prevotii]|uniref:G5 domain-containing protein n=1 Tax=Anaerococcus prevotii (strain ATCC 9321 / DSM 20548 / JCM 6508 / NCTC 11806 / PC1) TaxID=525919 RepID=C7RGN1_ANAPD|nr:hypothetical protein [Anaerococcus prevotii]ACV28642.1 hypothetical protein Apre_0600 [Anaerococcus prevotii DSM 20548]SUU94204.1 Uncharacterised protein [Anaerococcus prevotii]